MVSTKDVDRRQLHAQIDAIEQRLAVDRNQFGADLRGLARTLRANLVAPSAIATAVVVGMIVEQGSRHRTWSLAPVLEGLSVANKLAVMLGSLVKSLNVAADA